MSGKVTGGNILFSINSIQAIGVHPNSTLHPRVWVLNYSANVLKYYQTNSKM